MRDGALGEGSREVLWRPDIGLATRDGLVRSSLSLPAGPHACAHESMAKCLKRFASFTYKLDWCNQNHVRAKFTKSVFIAFTWLVFRIPFLCIFNWFRRQLGLCWSGVDRQKCIKWARAANTRTADCAAIAGAGSMTVLSPPTAAAALLNPRAAKTSLMVAQTTSLLAEMMIILAHHLLTPTRTCVAPHLCLRHWSACFQYIPS